MEKELKSEYIINEKMNDIIASPMTSIPHNDVLKLYNSTIRRYPKDIFNKTMYLVYKGALRQFKIRKEFIFPFNYTRTIGNGFLSIYIRNVYLIEIAGIGELYVLANQWGYAFNFNIYETIEDFKVDNHYDKCEQMKLDEIEKLYANHCSFSHDVAYQFEWNGVSVDWCKWVDDVSLFFTFDGKEYALPKELANTVFDLYPSKEECENANTINIIGFDDIEEEKEYEVTAAQLMTRKFNVKATNFNSACDKVLELLKDSPLNSNKDGLEIEFI